MTEEEILELVKEYFKEGGIRDDGSCSEYYGDPDAYVKFALLIHEDGYNRGYNKASYDAELYEHAGNAYY
jgi:hypothetical protein